MEDIAERVRQPISRAEMERRWSETRKAMASQGIDCLLLQTSNSYFGMYIRWLTNITPDNGQPWTVLFPASEEMTVICHGATGEAYGGAGRNPGAHGVNRRLLRRFFPSIHYTNLMDAEAAVEDLKAQKARRVGIVGKFFFSAAFYEYLVAHLEGVEIVDATDLVDRIKVIKSPEEVALIRKSAQIQDEAWSEILNSIRPGKKEYEVRSELQRILVNKGSEEQWLMVGSASPGQPGIMQNVSDLNRTLNAGDQMNFLIEVNGPGGYYTEIYRTACLGPVPDKLAEAFEGLVEALGRTAGRMVPGAQPEDILKAHNDYMVSRGYPPEVRALAHGQGYDIVERPLIREDEPMTLAPNMNIALHQFDVINGFFVACCDNYLIGEHGAERLHKTPFKVFEV